MIMLLTLKAALKKAWVWMKHNWKVPFIIIYTLALWFLFRKKDAAYRVLEERNNSYKNQIDIIISNIIQKKTIKSKFTTKKCPLAADSKNKDEEKPT